MFSSRLISRPFCYLLFSEWFFISANRRHHRRWFEMIEVGRFLFSSHNRSVFDLRLVISFKVSPTISMNVPLILSHIFSPTMKVFFDDNLSTLSSDRMEGSSPGSHEDERRRSTLSCDRTRDCSSVSLVEWIFNLRRDVQFNERNVSIKFTWNWGCVNCSLLTIWIC